MSHPENVVNVSREWFERVEKLLKSFETQIRENGVPLKPGFFHVNLTNDTEVGLKAVIRDIAIQRALEAAITQQKQAEMLGGSNESDPAKE